MKNRERERQEETEDYTITLLHWPTLKIKFINASALHKPDERRCERHCAAILQSRLNIDVTNYFICTAI